MYCHARLCVCLSTDVHPHYCTDADVTWGRGRGCPLVVHYFAGFAIGARVALLWQHNANPSYKLASIPRYDDIVNGCLSGVCVCCWPVTGGWQWAFSKLHAVYGKWAWLAGRWLAVDGGVLNITAAAGTVGFHWWPSGNITRTRVHACTHSMPSYVSWFQFAWWSTLQIPSEFKKMIDYNFLKYATNFV